MRMALCRRKTGENDCVVKRGGNLAYAAARLFHQFAVYICTGRPVPLGLGTLSRGLIERKFLARLSDQAVKRFGSQFDVLVSVLVGRGRCAIGSNHLIQLLGLCLRDLRSRLLAGGFNHSAEIFIL